MNKQLLLTILLAMTVILSVSAVSASEVNVTDSYTTSLVDDTSDASVHMENTADSSVLSVSSDSNVDNDSSKVSLSSEEVLESENSNTLSTNSGSDSLDSDDALSAAYGEDKLSATKIDASKTITSKDVTKYYKGSTLYSATFLKTNGKPLANTNVKITVNKVTYTKKTNAKGVASLAINLKPGSYKVVSTNPVTGYKLTNTFKILSTISASDVTKVYTDGRKFYATFLKSNGKALANKNIKFKINGKTYTKKTNSKGVASITMYNLKKGTYKMISYNVDGLTKTNTVKVVTSTSSKLITKSYTFLKSDKKTIKVTLHNGLGYAPGQGKIVKFTVNGKTYSAKTNSKGVASLKLPTLKAGTYTVKYKFAGNNFYKASSASDKLYILPSKTPTYTVKSSTTFGEKSNAPFKVALTSGSVPLVGKTVTLNVNGKTYDKTTDSNGVVSVPINLTAGKYTITYAFKGDSKVNSKTDSSKLTVKERTATKITWKSGTSFYQGAQTYKVLLSDKNGKALEGKAIKLTVNSRTYSATTASNGYATFNVNVAPGSYKVSINFDAIGDNDYAQSSKSASINVEKKTTTGYGYWVYGYDMKKVDLKTLASQGTTDLFLNYGAISKHGQSAVESWIVSANKLGMNVHIWMQTFYEGGKWVNPVKSGSANTAFFNQKIAEAKKYAKIKGVAGIHFDYLRYPGTAYKTTGGTEAINKFVKQATEAIHDINSNLIVSCALMPETTNNEHYYGQDYSVISQYMDVVVPMIYKGNYGKTSSWITTTAKWFVDNSKGANVWAGIQSYKSDDDVTKLSASAIKTDAQAALNGEAPGVIIFRWGVTNFVDFKSLSDKSSSPTTTGSVTIAAIVNAANTLKSSIASKGYVPSTVTVGGVSYSTSQFLYMMTKAVEYINSGKTSTQILPVESGDPSNPSGSVKDGKLTCDEFVSLAKKISKFIVNNNRAPNYSNTSLGHMKYDSLVDSFAKILSYYKTNDRLPKYLTIKDDSKPAEVTKTVSVKDVITGATNLKTYYTKNSQLPSTVTAGGIKFALPEFLYAMSQAIYQIGNSNNKDIKVIMGISEPNSPSGDSSSGNLKMNGFLALAKNISNYIDTNKKAPNYASSDLGKIYYSDFVDAFSRILAFYGNDNRLPSYVSVGASSSATTASGSGLNEKNTITNLAPYLKASTNCQVDNSKIKTLVDSLTKGLTTDLQKATAIYNYVRDTISYSFYYDTKYGAVGTLNAKTGNCVDHSHLLVAMFRTADIPARYVHGKCTFSSGSTYGHVWAQVLVDGQWKVADATSSRNSLGKVANWNTNSFTLKSITSGISF